MKKLILRLRAQKGESLLESLASILVVAISSALLVSTINGASKTNLMVRANDDAYQEELRVAEQGTEDVEGKISILFGGAVTYTYDVEYAGAVGKLRSYDKAVTTP